MSTKVPIRSVVTLTLTCDIDITEQATLKTKMTQVVQDLKTQFPSKITDNTINVKTEFKEEEWKV
jgi:hypothetical protein